MNTASLKIHKLTLFAIGDLNAVKAVDLQKFLTEQDRAKTGTVVFVDCQSDGENTGEKFSGAYQVHTTGSSDARVCFQAGGKGSPSRLEGADLVIFYCVSASTRSPAAMASYKDYLKSKRKTQEVVLLEGGISSFQRAFPKYKTERWARPTFTQPMKK